MDDVVDLEWADAPWWLDAVCSDDVAESAEVFGAAGEHGPLTPAETLLAASLAGPGPEAMRLLSCLRGQPLSDDERLTALELWQGQLGWVTGAEQTALVDLVGLRPSAEEVESAHQGKEFVSLEVAAALNVTPGHAANRIAKARLLCDELKATGDLMRAGLLDPYRVHVVCETLTTVTPEVAQAVEAQLLPTAATITGTQLRKALREACRKADPDWGIRMFAKSRTKRRVGFDFDGTDGLVLMYAYLPPVEAVALQEHLHQAATVPSPDPDDDRDLGERMADALIASVLGSTPGDPTTPLAPKVLVQLLMSLPTLLGLREDTGQLAGYGPIPAGVARELAADAEFQRMVYDPVTGYLLDYKDKHYRLPAELDRFCAMRDRHCRFPGSTRPAHRCDNEHTDPFDQGGPTSAANTVNLSRHPHRAKTHGDYRTHQDPDGTLHWITPLGRRYTTHPWDYRPDSER